MCRKYTLDFVVGLRKEGRDLRPVLQGLHLVPREFIPFDESEGRVEIRKFVSFHGEEKMVHDDDTLVVPRCRLCLAVSAEDTLRKTANPTQVLRVVVLDGI